VIRKNSTSVTFIFPLGGREYKTVGVAGTFNRWNPSATPMVRSAEGQYVATLTLEPGEHQFRYCADGQWVNDPEADAEVPNGLGGRNCVVRVVKSDVPPPPAKTEPKPTAAAPAPSTAPAQAKAPAATGPMPTPAPNPAPPAPAETPKPAPRRNASADAHTRAARA
jgi:hypothetical protein